MSAAKQCGIDPAAWSAKQAGVIIEFLRGEFPDMPVLFELPIEDEYERIAILARATERALEVEDAETNV